MAGVGKFILDFLGNTAKSIAAPVVGTGEDIGTDIFNVAHGTNLTPQQRADQIGGAVGDVARAGQDVSQATGTGRNLAGNVAGTAVLGAAGAIGKGAASAVGLDSDVAAGGLTEATTTTGAKIASGAAKGAVEGAAVGGSFGATQGVGSAKNAGQFALDFLQGAGTGAAFGGVVGGGIPAVKAVHASNTPLNEVGSTTAVPGAGDVRPQPSDKFAPEDLQKMAESNDPKAIAKQLEPVTGKPLAQQIAPAIVKSNDPYNVANIIDRTINNKLTPDGLEEPTPSPAPTPLPPATSVSDVNTPTQVAQQGSDEESLFASGEQQPSTFMNGPNEEAPAASQVSKTQAMTGMNEILNDPSRTVDEALNHYMQNVPGSNYQDAQDAFANLRGQDPESLNQGNVNQVLNPRYEEGKNLVDKPIAQGDTTSVSTKTEMAHNAVMREGTKAIVETRKLSPQALQFMDASRDKTPEQVANAAGQLGDEAPQFLKAWQAVTNYDNLAQGVGSGGLGQDVAFRQNHLLTRYTTAGEPTGEIDPDASAQQPFRPGYGKGRVGGGTPRFDNFLQDLEHDVNKKSNDIAGLTFSKSINEAFPDQVAQGNLPQGYDKVRLPFANGVALPQDVADELNERMNPKYANSKTGQTIKGYDTVNSAIKNLKLGGGLFHALNVMGSFVGQQILSGKAFTNPGAIGDVMKSTFSDKAMNTQMSMLDKQGMLRASDRLGLVYNKFGVSADVGADSNRINNLPFLKQIHEAIFGRQIPMMKVLTLQQKLSDAGIDPSNMSDEDIQNGTKMAKQINKQFGGLNRQIQGLTPQHFRVLSRVLLATDYTESQLETLVDAFTKGGADGKLARETVAGKALLWGGLATGLGAAGGEFQGKDPKQVAEDIAYKAINPSFQFGSNTIGLPETQLSEFTKPIGESINNAKSGANTASPFKDFLSARLAGVPALGEEVGSNRTFSGNALRGTDYYGRPISGKQTAANIASTLLPIPLSNTAETATGQQSLGAAIGNTAGLNVKPTYPASYAPISGQTYISQLEKTPGVSKAKINNTTEFYDLLEQTAHNKTKITTQAEKAQVAGNTQKADQIVQNYNQKLINALIPWAKSGGSQYIDSTMLQSLQTAELTPGKASENIPYLEQTNPTSIGASIQPLATVPNQ